MLGEFSSNPSFQWPVFKRPRVAGFARPLTVSRRADTQGTKINVAETKRVLSEAFLLLGEMDGAEAMDTVANGMKQARKKATKKKN